MTGPALSPDSGPRRAGRWALAVALLGAGWLALWVWTGGAEERALRRLPTDERRVVYDREVEALTTLCHTGRAEALEEQCRRRAEFLLKFPECDETCRRLVKSVLPNPRR